MVELLFHPPCDCMEWCLSNKAQEQLYLKSYSLLSLQNIPTALFKAISMLKYAYNLFGCSKVCSFGATYMDANCKREHNHLSSMDGRKHRSVEPNDIQCVFIWKSVFPVAFKLLSMACGYLVCSWATLSKVTKLGTVTKLEFMSGVFQVMGHCLQKRVILLLMH
jgi:hypothetical protein